MKELSLEYIAGFFDADGSVGIYERGGNRNAKSYQICVAIANSGYHGRIICEQLKERFGGTVTSTKLSRDNPNHRDVFWWRTNGRYVTKRFLEEIVDHSIIKQDQIKLALSFINEWEKLPRYKTIEQKEWMKEISDLMKSMKKKC